MAVRIRLKKRGRRKFDLYDIVIADQRAPRDGRFIEKVGNYNPNTKPASIILQEKKILQWLLQGAEPSPTVESILSSQGILLQKHLQVGVNKGAITQEKADQQLADWKAQKMKKATKFSPAKPTTKHNTPTTEQQIPQQPSKTVHQPEKTKKGN